MATPETRFAGNGLNDFTPGLSGNATWINPDNIVGEEGLTSDVQLISPDVNESRTSRIIRSRNHNFNLPDGIDSIDNIEVNYNILSQSGGNQVRYFAGLWLGGVGTVFQFNFTGDTQRFATFSGSPAALGHPGITATEINSFDFGAAFVAHDSGKGSSLVKLESVKVTVTFSGAGLTYTESNDFFFAQGSVLVNGKAKATPYFINLEGETDGGVQLGGVVTPSGGQSAVGEGGALLGGEAEVNPYFEVGSGGAVLGGIGHQTYIEEVAGGGLLIGGLTPNGTHDFGSGGVLVRPHGNLQVEVREVGGGIKAGGAIKATPYFIDLPGETDGGLKITQGRALTSYDEVGIGGIIIPAIPGHFFSFDPLFGSGGALLGGNSEVNPYFEVASGGVKLKGRSLNEVSWPGLPPFSLFNGSTLIGGTADVTSTETFTPAGGIINGGHTIEINTVETSGGALAGGKTLIAITQPIGGGVLASGLAKNQGVKTPLVSGGAVLGGNFTFHYFADGVGGVTVEDGFGIGHPIFKLFYAGGGPAENNVITVESAESTAITLWGVTYTGSGEVVIGGESPLSASYIYGVLGGVDVGGQSTGKASYGYNVVLGTGLVVGSVSNTSIPHVFRAIRWPKGSIGRSLKSDNMFKTEMESLLITTIPKNPVLEKGLSTTDITLNECNGAFVPPNLVNRQREHLPSPKQEAKNRSSQLAKSG